MAETSIITSAKGVTPPIEEKPDWLISSLQSKLPATINEMHEQNILAAGFSIREKDDYWARDDVKAAFTDEEGTVDKSAFDTYYADAANKFRTNLETEFFMAQNQNTYRSDIAQRLNNPSGYAIVQEGNPDIAGRFFNSNMHYEGQFGAAEFGKRENALNNYVLQSDGSKTSIDNYDFNKNVKFAKDDYGQYKLDEKGRPYLTEVEYGDKLKTYDEIYSTLNNITGKYGTGDNGWYKAGSAIMAIPKAANNLLAGSLEGLAIFGQAVTAPFIEDDSETSKFLNAAQNIARSATISSSDNAQANWTSLESIVDMGADAAVQLVAMFASGGALNALKMGKAASVVPRLGMSMLQAGSMYDVALEAGLTKSEALAAYGAALGGVYALTSADELLVNTLMGTGKHVPTAALNKFSKSVLDVAIENNKLTKAGLKSISKNFGDSFRSALEIANSTSYGRVAGSTLVEAAQETSEQAWDTSVRGLFNIYADARDSGLFGKHKGGKFEINWDDEIEAYKQSAVGGALGGFIAGSVMKKMFNPKGEPDDNVTGVMQAIIDGRENDLYELIDRIEGEGRFAPIWENAEGQFTDNPQESKNAIGAKIVRDNIKAAVAIRENNDFKNFKFSTEAKMDDKLKKLHQRDLLAGITGLSNDAAVRSGFYSKYTSAGADAARLALYIDTLNGKLNPETGSLSVDSKEEIQEKIDKAQVKLDKIKKGDFINDYVAEGLYNARLLSDGKDRTIATAITGKSFIGLNNELKSDTSNAKSKINKKAEEQAESNDIATVDKFENISKSKKAELKAELLNEQRVIRDGVNAKFNKTGEFDFDALLEDAEVLGLESQAKSYFELAKKINTLDKFEAVDDITPVTVEDERAIELSQYFNMVEPANESDLYGTRDVLHQDEIVKESYLDQSSNKSIIDKVEGEVREFDASEKNGTALYTNVKPLEDIKASIYKRMAQVQATFDMQGVTGIPNMSEEEALFLLNELVKAEQATNYLLAAANDNLNDPEKIINLSAIDILEIKSNQLNDISDAFAHSEYNAITEFVKNNRIPFSQALEDGDINKAVKLITGVENAIYEIFENVKNADSILNELIPENEIDETQYLKFKGTYDYLRGIISLKSDDFYIAYHGVLSQSKANKPSIEQALIIKETAQSLKANEYNLPSLTDIRKKNNPDGTFVKDNVLRNMHDSAIVDGGGGTGKTSIVETTVAGIISELNGKKAFFTSVDIGEKIAKIRKDAIEYGGLKSYSTIQTIEKLLADNSAMDEIGIIVFDEATLLSDKDLLTVIDKVNDYNKDKTGVDRIKILYGGDSYQNNITSTNTNKNFGIASKLKKLAPRTKRLNFSFRSKNRDLNEISNYFQTVQNLTNQPVENIGVNYENHTDDGFKGVRVIHERAEFQKRVDEFLTKAAEDGTIGDTVYITDREDISVKNVKVISSVDAQGEEWDNVILDLEDIPFIEGSPQYVTKQSYYTGTTRAKNFLLIHLPESQKVSSQKGKVHDIKPIELENNTLESELTRIEDILGKTVNKGDISDVDREIIDKQNSTEEFNVEDENQDTKPQELLSEFISTRKNNSLLLHTFFTAPRINTEGETENLAHVLALKAEMLYGKFKDVSGIFEYNLVIAKNGSPEYTNVIENDAQYDGKYALFLEGTDTKANDKTPVKTAVLGIFGGDTTFDADLIKLVDEGNILENGATVKKIKVDRSIFLTEDADGNRINLPPGTRRKGVDTQLAELMENSPGISWGTPRVYQEHIIEVVDGKEVIKVFAGQPFIPASFELDAKSIDARLSVSEEVDARNEPKIIPIFLNEAFLTEQEIFTELEQFLIKVKKKNSTDTFWAFPTDKYGNLGKEFKLSNKLGSYYASLFGRLTTFGTKEDSDNYAIFNVALAQVLDDVKAGRTERDTQFEALLSKYVNTTQPDTSTKNGYAPYAIDPELFDISTLAIKYNDTRGFNFMMDYVVAKKNGWSKAVLYERAFNAIKEVSINVNRIDRNDPTAEPKTTPKKQFKKGFKFSTIADKKTGESSGTLKSVHSAAPELYNKYLSSSNTSAVRPPAVMINQQAFAEKISLATPKLKSPTDTNNNMPSGKIIAETPGSGDGQEDLYSDPIITPNGEQESLTTEGSNLTDFKNKHYSGSAINMLLRGIDKFKRGIWDEIFLVNDGTPTMQDISEAVNKYKARVTKVLEDNGGKKGHLATPEFEAFYHDAVAAIEFDFLMKTYFPVLIKDSNGNYQTVVTSNNNSIYDKESSSLLDDTMNEMIKTMLFNTKELYMVKGKIYERDNYLDINDVEDAIEIFASNYNDTDILEAMKDHIFGSNNATTVNPVILSLYYKFYAEGQHLIGNVKKSSLNAINNDTTPYEMVQGLTVFLETAAAYKYAYVEENYDKIYKNRPRPGGKKPKLLRDALFNTLLEAAPHVNVSSVPNSRTLNLKIDGSTTLKVFPGSPLSYEELTEAFQTIGLSMYNEDVMSDLQNTRDEEDVSMRGRMTRMLHGMLGRINKFSEYTEQEAKDEFSSIVGTNSFEQFVVNPISREAGVSASNMYINLRGDKVNRLRDKTPLHAMKIILNDIALDSQNMYADNLLANKTYEIVDWVTKDGFKYFNKGFTSIKRHTGFIESETIEHDVIWNFFDTLENTVSDSGLEAFAMFSPVVYSDGSTDMMPMVKMQKSQLENPETVLRQLFDSQRASYSKIKNQVLDKTYPIKGLLKDETFTANLDKFVNGDADVLYEAFKKGVDEDLTAEKEKIFSITNGRGDKFIQIKLANGIPSLGMTNEHDVMRAFYYNWLAVSTEFTDIVLGKLDNFKVGKDYNAKFVDFTKRAKMLVSNRSAMNFRIDGWAAKVEAEGLTPRLALEGRKLSRKGKVVFIKDITRNLSTIEKSREANLLTGNQVNEKNGNLEIFDGATFTNSVTRRFQEASSGGRFGIKVPTVSKPVTNSLDPKSGVATGIKNAEFELTPEILRNSTSISRRMMDIMLNDSKEDLIAIVQAENPGANEDTVYDYVTDEHFEALTSIIVSNGNQDNIIHEVIPLSSRKYGGGFENDITGDAPIITEEIDFLNKGQQLDASHDVNEHSDLSMLTQYLNIASTNFKNPEIIKSIYGAVNQMVEVELERWSKLNDKPNGEVKHVVSKVREAINKRIGLSYQHDLVNSGDFNFSDRQIYSTVYSQINAILEENGVRIKIFGNQYVLHPQSSLINLVKAEGRTMLYEDAVKQQLIIDEQEVDLAWTSPSRNGEALEDTIEYKKLLKTYNDSGKSKKALGEFQNALDVLLSDGTWENGEAEMLLPMSFAKQFNLTKDDLNRSIDEYDVEFFTTQLSKKYKGDELIVRAEAMANDFQESLTMLNVRIPTTGKHSAVVSKIVGFLNNSDNSVFVPPMLLFVQGADQDIDKGNITGEQAHKGIIPRVDDDFNLDERTKLFFPSAGRGSEVYKIALGNKVSKGLMDITLDPKNIVEGNSAVDALLAEAKSLVKNKKAVYNKNKYTDYVRLRRSTQAGKALVGIFANAQKAYITMQTFGNLNDTNLGVKNPEGLDRISETFAMLINAATDNAKEQVLGPLGINESNANMVAYMVIQGKSISEISKFLEDNASDFEALEASTRYDAPYFSDKKFINKNLVSIYRAGQELGLIGSSILNTELPNSAFDNFKYKHKINTYIQKLLGEPFDFETFIIDEQYAAEYIDLLQANIDEVKRPGNSSPQGVFNFLKILNPFNDSHPSNAYIKMYAKSRELKNKHLKILKNVDKLISDYMAAEKPGNAVSEDIYKDGVEFIYGLSMHDYLKNNDDPYVGEFDLSTLNGRTDWITHFNNKTIFELKTKYGKGDKKNPFIDQLRPIVVKKFGYDDSVSYGLLDMNTMSDDKIMVLDEAFNNPNLIDEADRRKLILYNLITSGGKYGKGSYAQIFRADHPMLKDYNTHLENYLTDDIGILQDLSETFNDYVSNKPNGELLVNAIPYGYSGDTPIKDKLNEGKLILTGSKDKLDDILAGNKNVLAVTDVASKQNNAFAHLIDKYNNSNKRLGGVLPTITKIISSGKTGIETVGLEVAQNLGIITGGLMRKGFVTEPGLKNPKIASTYGLNEGGIEVSKNNVENSDVTIIHGGIDDSQIKNILQHAKNVGKPVFVHNTNTSSLMRMELSKVDVEFNTFNTAASLRKLLVSSGHNILNIVGTKGSKSTKKNENIFNALLSSALTEYNEDSYASATDESGDFVGVNENGDATFYGSSSENTRDLSEVYYAILPESIMSELTGDNTMLRPAYRNEAKELVFLDNTQEVIQARTQGENVRLILLKDGEIVPHQKLINFALSPNYDMVGVLTDTATNNQFLTSKIRTIDKGEAAKSPVTDSIVLEGVAAKGTGKLTYHGKMSPVEAKNIVKDDKKYVDGYKLTSRTSDVHIFTISPSEGIIYDKLDASSPSTFLDYYNADGDITSPDHKTRVYRHVQSIITNGDVNEAVKYLEEFGENTGTLYENIAIRLRTAFPRNLIGYSEKFSDEAKRILQEADDQGDSISLVRARNLVLRNAINNLDGKKLTRGVKESLIKDINSFTSASELNFYMGYVVKNADKVTTSDFNFIGEEVNARIKTLKGKATDFQKKIKKKKSSTKTSKGDKAKNKKGVLIQSKQNGRNTISLKEMRNLLKIYDQLSPAAQQSASDSIKISTAAMVGFEKKQAKKLMHDYNFDAPLIENFTEDIDLTGHDGETFTSELIFAENYMSNIKDLLDTQGYKIAVTDKLTLLTELNGGKTVIEVLNDIVADGEYKNDIENAQTIIDHYDGIRRNLSDAEIDEAIKYCK